ncbi:MAG: hypothetical protein QXS19_05795 [Candidatus Methanomethylicia archaeon]
MYTAVLIFKKRLDDPEYQYIYERYRGLNFILIGKDENYYYYQVFGSDHPLSENPVNQTTINNLSSDHLVDGFYDVQQYVNVRKEYLSLIDLDPNNTLTITVNNITCSYRRKYTAIGTDGRLYYVYVLDEVV